MRFNKISIQNFLSIKRVDIDLDGHGLILINGRNMDNPSLNNNGAGKSSILEAIIYALYGRTIRGLKGDAVVNNITQRNTKVFLDLTDDDGTEYRIARYRKHDTNKNKIMLFRNGMDITPKSEADFDAFIVNLLQADYLTFTSSLLYTAESFKFTTATDAEIKKTFDTMLNLDVLSKCLEVTRRIASTVNTKLHEKELLQSNLEDHIEQVKKSIEAQQERHEAWETEHAIKITQVGESKTSLREKSKALDDEYANIQDRLTVLSVEADRLEKSLSEKEKSLDKVSELKSELLDVKSEIKDIELNIKGCTFAIKDNEESIQKCEGDITKEQKQIDRLQQKCDDLDSQVGQPCPVCKKPLDAQAIGAAKQEYLDTIKDHESTIQDIRDTITQKTKHSEKLKVSMDEYNVNLQELQEQRVQFEGILDKCKHLEESKREVEIKLKSVTNQKHALETKAATNRVEQRNTADRIIQLDKDLEELLNESNPYSETFKELMTQQSKWEHDLVQVGETISKLKDKQECLEFWEKAYSNQGIKSFILDDITPFLNRRVNKYLSKLTSGQIEVVFSTRSTLKSGEEREKFSIEVINHHGGGQYAANSGGEKKRIDLAINLALQDLVASRGSKKINIAIFDEVFDALDENGIDGVVSLLQELTQSKSTILVVSHNEYLKAYFTNIMTVVKQGGFSSVLDGEPVEQCDAE